jgi:uncharacterized membrane protein
VARRAVDAQRVVETIGGSTEGRLATGSADDERLEPEELGDEDRVLLIFSYMGPLSIVSLIAARKEFVKWHAKQGLILFLAAVATFLLLRPFHALFYLIWGFLGDLFLTVEILVLVGFLIIAILCLVRALEGERFRLPFFSEVADRF